ncbi:hypothetical protein PVK74_30455 [Micromonospora chalcea]|uniref:hypothetical protein n=1 Tax=Micromonospora chalcea TaxID=1874 RepID=UPI0023781FCA|nr:hypothetical protein [Micromonospora chalcea]WDQ00096.1 hypothetical protein PVK74_30455 [Micromonospora chalcea]
MGWFSEIWRTRAQDWSFGSVGPAGTELVPDEQYVSVNLREFHIADVRLGRQRLYGTVTSSCSVVRRAGGRAESIVVTTPGVLRDVDPDNLDRVVTGTTRLLGPVPYRGGGIDLELGLFTVPSRDLLGPYLNLLEQAASLAGVGLVAKDAGIVGLVKEGLNTILAGRSGPELEIGLAHTFDQPVTGTYAVIRTERSPSREMPAYQPGHGLRWSDGNTVAEPYIVFSIDADQRREDWPDIPNLADAYDQLRIVAERGDLVGATELLAAFRRMAVFSSGLLARDGERLYDLIRSEIARAFPTTATGTRTGRPGLPPLAELDPFDATKS